MPGLLDDLAEEPTTMIHGDFRADNLFFEADGSVAAVDFQLIGTGRGAYDLAYFVTQSLDRRRRRRARAGALRPLDRRPRWRPACPRPTSPTAWDDYRAAALFCLVYPVVAWRGMDAGDPRQLGLATTMLERFDRAVAELDLADARCWHAWRIRRALAYAGNPQPPTGSRAARRGDQTAQRRRSNPAAAHSEPSATTF